MGGYDRDGPQLYMIEPSGVAYVGPQSPCCGFVHPYGLFSFLLKFTFHINVLTKLLTLLLSLFFSLKFIFHINVLTKLFTSYVLRCFRYLNALE